MGWWWWPDMTASNATCSALVTMSSLPGTVVGAYSYLPPLMSPVHPLFPFGVLDVVGAMRLSSVGNWFASGAFEPPDEPAQQSKQSKRAASKVKQRPTLLHELTALMVVVFGGETFLGMCTGTPPSWLISPYLALLFIGIHTLQTRTPLIHLLPKGPSLALELLFSLPDAINRALLLTRFSVVPLLHPLPGAKALPATPSTLILVPFILAVPFASIAFSGATLFSPSYKVQVPDELKPYGWALVDFWIAVVNPVLFLGLIGPVDGWPFGLRWTENEALVAVIAFTWVVFVLRAFYNFGHQLTSKKSAPPKEKDL